MKEFVENNYSKNSSGWIPCRERFPEKDEYILLSFVNFSIPVVGRYEEDENGGAFYVGDETESCISHNLIVNAWQQLPKPYNPDEQEKKEEAENRVQTRIEHFRSMSVEEIADVIMASEISTDINFCTDDEECKEMLDRGEIDEKKCKKCLIKWLNSVEEKEEKRIPTDHLLQRFYRIT